MERYAEIVDDYDAFVEACDHPLPRTARINRVKSSWGEVRDAYDDADVGVERLNWHPDAFVFTGDVKPGNTLPHYAGWVHVQEEVSMLPPVVLGADEDDLVLDLCAAPGSKTGALAQDACAVVANDVNIGRLSALRNNADRLGLTNVAVTSYDGRSFPGEQTYDGVVVDVPCTAEGTVRKNPGAGASQTDEDERASVVGVQKGLLRRALSLVKDDGRVVYSTCTFAPEENEAVVDSVLDEARVVDADLPLRTASGITDWRGETYDDAVARTHRVYPHHNDTGGFYVAVLEPTP